MTETLEDFPTQGEHLMRLIELAGTNITQLAKASGVNRETLSRIVNDRYGLGPSVAKKIAPVLNVTLETLVLPPDAEVESRRGLHLRLKAIERRAERAEQTIEAILDELLEAGIVSEEVAASLRF